MKSSGSRLLGHTAMVASAGAVLLFSVAAGQAQSSPFTGFNGAWSGNGTISMSDGSTERIRCRATYAVGGGGRALSQTLRCASDSYKFDLSSNVTSDGNRVSGNWSESSRNVSGSLQGTAGSGQINVAAEGVGFSANLTVRTTGNRQTVQIRSEGDIRSVSISMVKS